MAIFVDEYTINYYLEDEWVRSKTSNSAYGEEMDGVQVLVRDHLLSFPGYYFSYYETDYGDSGEDPDDISLIEPGGELDLYYYANCGTIYYYSDGRELSYEDFFYGDTCYIEYCEVEKPGYIFAGWKMVGTNDVFQPGDDIYTTNFVHYNNASLSVKNFNGVECHLEAQWDPVYTYTIKFNGNGHTGGSLPSTMSETGASTSVIMGDIEDAVPTRTGHVFRGWSASSTYNSKRIAHDKSCGGAEDRNGDSATITHLNLRYNNYCDYTGGNSSSRTLTLYAQWEPNILTINYYSNYADYGTLQGQPLNVSADKNVLVVSENASYSSNYDINNVQNQSYLYLSRTNYTPTWYWGTSLTGGKLIHQDTIQTGQAIALALGKDISNGNASVNIYAQWSRDERIEFNGKIVDRIVFNGKPVEHLVYNGSQLF